MPKRTKRLTSQGEEQEEIRINKFLSEAGVCSRREADRYIEDGKVEIDGIVAQMGSRVKKDSKVTFCGKPVMKEEKLVLIAFNKPEGIVCTTDSSEPDNIIDYISYGMRIFPIGRLDKDSEGLILLTNDGNIVNKILRAENYHEKEYIVRVNNEITADFIKKMSEGVPILDKITNPCKVDQIDRFTFSIILTQGLNRQIRRMCEYCGYRVVNLVRIRIMNIKLGRLKTGDYRNVTEKEIEELNLQIQQNKRREDDKKPTDENNDQEKKSFDNKKEQGKKPFIKRDNQKKRPYTKGTDWEKRPYTKGTDGEKRPYIKGTDGEKRPYAKGTDGEKRPYVKGTDGEKKPYSRGAGQEKRPYTKGTDGEKRTYSKETDGEKRSYSRGAGQEKRPYTKGTDREKRPYSKETDGEKRPYSKGVDQGKKPYTKGTDQEKKVYVKGGNKDKKSSVRVHGQEIRSFLKKRGEEKNYFYNKKNN